MPLTFIITEAKADECQWMEEIVLLLPCVISMSSFIILHPPIESLLLLLVADVDRPHTYSLDKDVKVSTTIATTDAYLLLLNA